jgi:lipopolysaccharide export system protein LptA
VVTTVKCPWTFHMEVVEGKTVVTAKSGDEIQMKLTCDKLDLQAPRGSLHANGAVKLTGPGLEASSDKLVINLQEERVTLEGKAEVKSQRQGQLVELQSDRLSLRLSAIPDAAASPDTEED